MSYFKTVHRGSYTYYPMKKMPYQVLYYSIPNQKSQKTWMTNSSLDHLKGSSKKNISCHLKKVLSQPYSLTVFIHVPTFNQYVLNPLNHFKYKVRGVGTIFFWFFNGICASLMAMNEIQRNSSHREFLRWDIDKSCRLK